MLNIFDVFRYSNFLKILILTFPKLRNGFNICSVEIKKITNNAKGVELL